MAKHLQSGDKRAADRFSSILYPTRRTALSLAIAIALGMPGMVQAQDAPAAEGELEEIVVTGIRAGIESAIAVKQESMSIVEAISAEDIGKLPDTSIAESISRLPGLTSQRAEGRASAISLRGTDPGFTTALLNGREQVSTGDNRNVEFDQYPSELISQVVVYKTPDSQLVGQGLAGTIDMRTVRPLDYGKQAIALNIRGEMNSNDDLGADSDDTGYRASFSYIDQFMDGKLGFAFGYAHLDSPLATRGFGTYEPWNAAGSSGGAASCGGGSPANCINNPGIAAGNYVTNGMKVRADMGSTERDGLMASLQFEPNDFYTGVVDLYYSTMDQTNNARSLEVNLGGYPAPCCDGTFPAGTVFGYSNTTVAADTIVAGTLNNVMPLVRNFLFTTEDEIFATGWRNEFTLNDEWSMVADISYSKATRDQLQPEINAQYVPLPANGTAPRNQYDTGTFQLRNNSNMPSLSFLRDYTDPTQVQIGPTIYGSGYTKKPHTEDELTSFRLDATRTGDLWWFDSFSFGANYSDRSKEKESPESGLSTIGGGYLPDRPAVPAAQHQPELRGCRPGAGAQRERRAARVLQPGRLGHAAAARLRLPCRQVLDGRGRGHHRVRARRPEPRHLRLGHVARQRRRAGDLHGPELRLVPRRHGRGQRGLRRHGRQGLHRRPAADQPGVHPAGFAGRPRRSLAATGPCPHGPAEGDGRERLQLRHGRAGRQRRQRAAGPVEGLGPRRVVREVLLREQGLRLGRRVLQGPGHLHLQPDDRRARLLRPSVRRLPIQRSRRASPSSARAASPSR